MSFYKSIAEVYHHIFPLNPVQVKFTNSAFFQTSQLSLLDIGCGTGALTRALSATFQRVVGIDLDEVMLEHARSSSDEINPVRFQQMNMLDIDQQFKGQAFDAIVCFGNTLVHLSSVEEITSFFEKCHRVLTPNGKLLIQVINYDRILDQHVTSLPTLENEEIKFIRNYHYQKELHQIDFETLLSIKKSNQTIRNSVPLFPVRRSELEKALEHAGFTNIRFFGNFKRDPLTHESIPLVFEANR